MDTGKKNKKYYEGYEGSTKVILMFSTGEASMEIWEGYFADMLDRPDLSGNGWKGFTRDFHQCEGIWGEDAEYCELDVDDYLQDLRQYVGKVFDYSETTELVSDLTDFLSIANNAGVGVAACIEE